MNWALHPCPLIPDFTRLRVCNRKRGRPFKLKSRIRTKKKLPNEWQVVCLTGPTQSTSGQWQSISRFNSFIRILLSTRLSLGCRSHRGDFSIDFFFWKFFFWKFFLKQKMEAAPPNRKSFEGHGLSGESRSLRNIPLTRVAAASSSSALVRSWTFEYQREGPREIIHKKKTSDLGRFFPQKNSKNSTEICFNQQPLMGSTIGVNCR